MWAMGEKFLYITHSDAIMLKKLFFFMLLMIFGLPLLRAESGCCLNPNKEACSFYLNAEECCPPSGYPSQGFGPRSQAECMESFFYPSPNKAACALLPEDMPELCQMGCCCRFFQSDEQTELLAELKPKVECVGDGYQWLSNVEECNKATCSQVFNIPLIEEVTNEAEQPPLQTATEQTNESIKNDNETQTKPSPKQPNQQTNQCNEMGGVCRRGIGSGGLLALLGLLPWCNSGETIMRGVKGCGTLQSCCIPSTLELSSNFDSSTSYELVVVQRYTLAGKQALRLSIPRDGTLYYNINVMNSWFSGNAAFAKLYINSKLVTELRGGKETREISVRGGDQVSF
ncbi:hypothetical protein DRJ48_02030, partial [Candidatus Woesearchaeota archaeon]